MGEYNITLYGTIDDPLVRCKDLIVSLLGYKRTTDAKWFRNMTDELKSEFLVQCGGLAHFTEQGVYWGLMKS